MCRGLPAPPGRGEGASLGGAHPQGVGQARHRGLLDRHRQATPGPPSSTSDRVKLPEASAGLLSARGPAHPPPPRLPGRPPSRSLTDTEFDTERRYPSSISSTI